MLQNVLIDKVEVFPVLECKLHDNRSKKNYFVSDHNIGSIEFKIYYSKCSSTDF